MRNWLVSAAITLAAVSATLVAKAALADPAAPTSPAATGKWVAVWQDQYKDHADNFDPEKLSVEVYVDRTTGDVFLAGWDLGVWKSSDAGKTFARVDGGKITGPGCGPIMGHAAYAIPDGKKMAVFNMNNAPGLSGYSLDGGQTWVTFKSVERNWDFGAMDFDSKTVIGARHEADGLHVSTDGGQTWTQLAKSRGGISGLGVMNATTLLAGSGGLIERSEDAGKTWAKVSDLGGTGPALNFKGKTWWLSGSDKAGKNHIIISTDAGKTWAAQGEAIPEPALFGPYFGKDENQIVVVTRNGFYETTDGCKTWKLAAALPANFSIEWAQSGAYDPIHDIFYLANRARSLMKFERGGTAAVAGPAPELPDRPRAKFVEAVGGKPLRVLNVFGVDVVGNFVYVASEDGLVYLKRDTQSGKLTLVEQVGDARGGAFNIRAAGGRLYAVTPHDGYRRLTWHGLATYDLDATTGKPVQRAAVVECPASRQIIAGPGGKDLYLKSCGGKQDKLFWYRIGEDGKPAKAGEAAGKGIGESVNSAYPSLLQLSPDGKFLYTASAKDYAIAIVERKPSGEIAYKGSVDLDPVVKRIAGNDRYLWLSLAIAPDGKYLYAAVRNGRASENFYGIFKRNGETGELTFQETVSGEKDELANLRAWTVAFDPDRTTGYLGSLVGPFVTLQYDAKTGHLTNPAPVKGMTNHGTLWMAFDAANRLLYGGGGDYGISSWTLDVLKADPAPGKN